MRRARVSKSQAEQAILERFADAYYRHFGAELSDISYRDRPDFAAVDSFTLQTLGIEVTGVYQDEREAEINYWIDGEWGIIIGNLDGLVSNINRALIDKAEKAKGYEEIGPFVLAIWIGSFIYNYMSDIKYIAPLLLIPDNPFSLIALVITDDFDRLPALYVLQELTSWRHNELTQKKIAGAGRASLRE